MSVSCWLECVLCVGCVRWAWKRLTYIGAYDSETWHVAVPDDFQPVRNADYKVLMDNKLGQQMFDGGYVHYGLLKSAQFILEKVTETLRDLLHHQGPNCRLVFAGHSLGSGITALMTVLVVNNRRAFDDIPRSHVRCYALAPARCMSLNLAVKYADVIYSIVLQVPATCCLLCFGQSDWPPPPATEYFDYFSEGNWSWLGSE